MSPKKSSVKFRRKSRVKYIGEPRLIRLGRTGVLFDLKQDAVGVIRDWYRPDANPLIYDVLFGEGDFKFELKVWEYELDRASKKR